jgi:hypothetical protein
VPSLSANLPHAVNILHTPKSHEKPLSATALILMRLMDFNKNKRTRHHPWCDHDIYVLGWGLIKPQAMVGAKAACHHGDTSLTQ